MLIGEQPTKEQQIRAAGLAVSTVTDANNSLRRLKNSPLLKHSSIGGSAHWSS